MTNTGLKTINHFVWVLGLSIVILLATAVPLLAQEEPPSPPSPAPSLESLQATIEAQAEQINELEARWEDVEEQNQFALDQTLFNFVTRPGIYIGAILTALGILLIWRSTTDVASRLRRWEENNRQTLSHFEREQALKLESNQQQVVLRMNEQLQAMQLEMAEREHQLHREIQQLINQSESLDPQLLARANQLLDTVMVPIRLPRGFNLGPIYDRLQLCGFENLCWYDNLGESPAPGITVVVIRSYDDAGRFRSQVQRVMPVLHPRETAFILYLTNSKLQDTLLEELQVDFANIAQARSPLEIAMQSVTIARGLQSPSQSQFNLSTT